MRYARMRLTKDTGSWATINEVTFNRVKNISRPSKVDGIEVTLGEGMEFYEDYTADKALDGDVSTWTWLAQHQRIGQTVTFAFDRPRTLFGATITMGSTGDVIGWADMKPPDGQTGAKSVRSTTARHGYVVDVALDGSAVQYVRIRITQDKRLG
ncbi:MAG: hypothetical protein ACLSAP_10090 [Oscillospiraceae bacterium]